MSKKDWKILVNDILFAINKIENYTNELSYEDFIVNDLVKDAVVRNIEIIGEASNRIPDDVKAQIDKIPWKKLRGIRNRIVHDYFGVDQDIIWQIISKELSDLKVNLNQLLNSN
ncbi:MAG: DUF86 domain-containing protein [Melioribacteraceae bacterium]|nr:MAG: DUF86 domain-containing protein [Melioribacteraceae bacterium]